MPGIAGIISDRSAAGCERLVRAMVSSMQHEDFCTSGFYSVSELGVYAGWVAHDGSFAASQPFVNEMREIVLLFSGECFIDPEERRALTHKDHKLTTTAADWLVHTYEQEGDRFFENLNGLFSGLLIDLRQRKAFLFNDRYGVERIYFHERDGEFYFASEAKALLRILPKLREFDTEGVSQFLAFGCTLEGRTLFRGINLLPGGSLWSFEDRNCQKRKYFYPQTWESQSPLSEDAFQSEFKHTFKRVLSRYLESDSKIGISLTSGLDSRLIVACRPQIEQDPICYTFSGQKNDTSDARLAARVAEACGLDHHVLRIHHDFFSDFASYVDRTVYITDGCLGSLGAHEIYFNGQARSLAPVRLTGVFGDEILRGRSMFKPLSISLRLVNSSLEKSLTSLRCEKQHSDQNPVSFAAFREIPESRFGIPAAARSQLTFRTPYLDNAMVALAYRVPESLRSSPLPVLSAIQHNSRALSAIPTDMGAILETNRLASISRRIFSRAAFKLDYFYSEGLPRWLCRLDPFLRQLNSGLGITGRYKFLHYRTWFQRELAPYVTAVLTDAQTRGSPFFNSDFLQHIAVEHARGRKNYTLEIDAVITLEAVERLLFRDLPRETPSSREARSAMAASSLCAASDAYGL
jgi:asparagine synthase (glutamine-hydrolysing)